MLTMPTATAAATKASDGLSRVSQQLQDSADSGDITDAEASALGDKLSVAQDSVDTVKNSDLSLLGDNTGTDPGSDVTAPSTGDVTAKPAAWAIVLGPLLLAYLVRAILGSFSFSSKEPDEPSEPKRVEPAFRS